MVHVRRKDYVTQYNIDILFPVELTVVRVIHGNELTIPSWSKWAAVNSVGEVIVFDDQPEKDIVEQSWFSFTGRAQVVAICDVETIDWENSLIYINGFETDGNGRPGNHVAIDFRKMKKMTFEQKRDILSKLQAGAILIEE